MGLDMMLESTPKKPELTYNQWVAVQDYWNWRVSLERSVMPFYEYRQKCGYADVTVRVSRKGIDATKEQENAFNDEAYWRKANAIHRWFVEHVQNGEDDCGYYHVSRAQIEELRDLCQLVLLKAKIRKDGHIDNPSACMALLPTQGGFFFGPTEYDEYYIEQLQETIELLDTVLDNVDFDKRTLWYHSSW